MEPKLTTNRRERNLAVKMKKNWMTVDFVMHADKFAWNFLPDN